MRGWQVGEGGVETVEIFWEKKTREKRREREKSDRGKDISPCRLLMCIIQDGRSSGRGDVCTPLELDILDQMCERNGERWRVHVSDVSVCLRLRLCLCLCVYDLRS